MNYLSSFGVRDKGVAKYPHQLPGWRPALAHASELLNLRYFYHFILLTFGLLLPSLALAQAPGRMGDGMGDGMMMMPGMGIMGVLMMITWILLLVFLVLAIVALIKYLREK